MSPSVTTAELDVSVKDHARRLSDTETDISEIKGKLSATKILLAEVGTKMDTIWKLFIALLIGMGGVLAVELFNLMKAHAP